MKRTHLVVALLVGLVVAPLGCAHTTEKVVRNTVTGGLKGTLEALNDPYNQELLRRLLQDTDVKQAAHDLTAAVTGGAVDGLTDAERQERVRKASDDYIRTVAAAVGKALDEDLSPAAARAVEGVTRGAVAGALSPANAQLARDMVAGVTRSTVTAFTQSTAQGLRDDLGPAVHKVLAEDLGPTLQRVVEDNLGPALRKVIEKDLQPAVEAALGGEDGGGAGVFARALTRQIVLGVNDGMSDLGISPVPSDKSGGSGGLLAFWLPILLGVLLLLLSVALIRIYLTRRALMRDRVRNDEMLVHILQAIKSSESTPGTPGVSNLDAVLARVQQRMPNLDAENPYFATIVGRAQLPTRGPAGPVARHRAQQSASTEES